MTHALRHDPVRFVRTHLPVSMAEDHWALDHALRLVAEAEGLDPLSVRDVATRIVSDGRGSMLVAEATADRRP